MEWSKRGILESDGRPLFRFDTLQYCLRGISITRSLKTRNEIRNIHGKKKITNYSYNQGTQRYIHHVLNFLPLPHLAKEKRIDHKKKNSNIAST